MAPKLQRKYDTTLITMDGTCAVARGQRVAFISRQGTSRGKKKKTDEQTRRKLEREREKKNKIKKRFKSNMAYGVTHLFLGRQLTVLRETESKLGENPEKKPQ